MIPHCFGVTERILEEKGTDNWSSLEFLEHSKEDSLRTKGEESQGVTLYDCVVTFC